MRAEEAEQLRRGDLIVDHVGVVWKVLSVGPRSVYLTTYVGPRSVHLTKYVHDFERYRPLGRAATRINSNRVKSSK